MAKNDAKSKGNGNGKDVKGASTPQAANMPLFYSNPTPLSAEKHAKLGLRKNFGLGFTKTINAVPINMIEMPQVCHFYPIAFSPDNNATPVAILGLRDGENLFLHDSVKKDVDGVWEDATYIPAYIRRYPFIFSEVPEKDQLTLCVDMNDNIVQNGAEQAFFDKGGKPTQLATNALEFCKNYHAAAQQTLEFSKALAASGLLVDREAQINVAGNKRINFSGFRIIDEKKLTEMKEKDFLEWRNKGWLPFLYAHLFSGAQWQRLTFLLNAKMAKEAA